MVRIYTFYDEDKPMKKESFKAPSLTDDSFFESLSDMVPRIMRGELPAVMSGAFEFKGDVSDDVMDGVPSDYQMDDLTDIDFAAQARAQAKAGSAPPHKAGAAKADVKEKGLVQSKSSHLEEAESGSVANAEASEK